MKKLILLILFTAVSFCDVISITIPRSAVYSENKIIKPNYPDIYKLSDLLYEVSETELKRNYVIAKTK
mgnify:CR=1 FL=1